MSAHIPFARSAQRPPTFAQDSPTLAQDSPTQSWIEGWVDFLQETLPLIFLVVVILVGIMLIVRAKGGLQKAIVFGIGAALVFLILTNVEALSDLFGEELPVEQD